MSLKITREAFEKIVEHACRDAPLEACGYLAAGSDGAVNGVFTLTNTDHSSEHFSFDPVEQFQAVRQMRSSGQTLRAVYHSHPRTPARPSVEDLRLASDPDLSYVIVSLAGSDPIVRSYRIREGVADEEAVILSEPPRQVLKEVADDPKGVT